MLFIKKPDALGELAAVIVDEAAWQKGLEGVTGRPLELTPGQPQFRPAPAE